jgi:hypothetical protein
MRADSSFVYFMQAGEGPIKIGFTTNPTGRLAGLQTGSPDTLTMRLVVHGDEELEASLHKRFEALHIRGEWFRAGPELLDLIAHPDKYDLTPSTIERTPSLWESLELDVEHQGPAKTEVVAFRLPTWAKERLDEIVNSLNDRAFEQGRAPVHTVSSFMMKVIEQKLWEHEVRVAVAELDKDGKPPGDRAVTTDTALRPASNVLAAIEKLRGAR